VSFVQVLHRFQLWRASVNPKLKKELWVLLDTGFRQYDGGGVRIQYVEESGAGGNTEYRQVCYFFSRK
jgi:hypothetical protein